MSVYGLEPFCHKTHKCRVRPPRAVVPPHRKEKLLVLITSVLWVCLSA